MGWQPTNRSLWGWLLAYKSGPFGPSRPCASAGRWRGCALPAPGTFEKSQLNRMNTCQALPRASGSAQHCSLDSLNPTALGMGTIVPILPPGKPRHRELKPLAPRPREYTAEPGAESTGSLSRPSLRHSVQMFVHKEVKLTRLTRGPGHQPAGDTSVAGTTPSAPVPRERARGWPLRGSPRFAMPSRPWHAHSPYFIPRRPRGHSAAGGEPARGGPAGLSALAGPAGALGLVGVCGQACPL